MFIPCKITQMVSLLYLYQVILNLNIPSDGIFRFVISIFNVLLVNYTGSFFPIHLVFLNILATSSLVIGDVSVRADKVKTWLKFKNV